MDHLWIKDGWLINTIINRTTEIEYMAWINTGDLPNAKTPRVEFTPRPVKAVTISTQIPPEMHESLVEYCETRRTSQAALVRYLLGKELWH